MSEADWTVTMFVLRKLFHVAMMAVPLAGWLVSYQWALVLAGALVAGSLAIEGARRWWPWVDRTLWRYLPSVFRDWEKRAVLGSTWFSLGTLAALLLFGRDAGGTAVLCLAWGDAAAELAGRRWGRPAQNKSWAGSLACLAACLAAGGVGVALGGLPPAAAPVGAAVATLTERWSPPPDDNLWIPLTSGLAMALVLRVL